MLKKTLLVKQNVDVSKYKKLTTFLKNKAVGHEPKKAYVLSKEDITKFIWEAPDDIYLMTKVALIFGIYGACRREELVNISINDIQDRDSVIVITIPKTKTNKKRIFTIVDTDQLSPITIYKKYAALRAATKVEHCRFFLSYRNKKCTKQLVGKNTFGAIPKLIAKYLRLPNPERYTGHSFRRTSATLLADSGADITTVKRHGGWKSSTVAEGYLEDSIQSKNKISQSLFSINQPLQPAVNNSTSTSVKVPAVAGTSSVKPVNVISNSISNVDKPNVFNLAVRISLGEPYNTINFQNVSNCVFNITNT